MDGGGQSKLFFEYLWKRWESVYHHYQNGNFPAAKTAQTLSVVIKSREEIITIRVYTISDQKMNSSIEYDIMNMVI
jgi:hypothetical protein